MHLIQFLLPVYARNGAAWPRSEFDAVRAELTERFGGVTAYVRTPAVGAWQTDDGAVCRDDVMLFEVLAHGFDRPWWSEYRRTLESRFGQDEVMLRAWPVETL